MEISRGEVVLDVLVRTEVLVDMRVLAETSIVNGEELRAAVRQGIRALCLSQHA
jgi:hypothetical protein